MRRPLRTCGLAVLFWAPASVVLAHSDGVAPDPGNVWTAWSLDPFVVVPIAAGAALYGFGLYRAWSRAGVGRAVTNAQVAAVAGGTLALCASLVWPLDAMGDSLFAAHMAQHIALMAVAAPLLVVGDPLPTLLRVLPRRWRQSTAAALRWRPGCSVRSWLSGPAVATLVQTGIVVVWLAPAALSAALRNDVVHAIMHASLFAAGLLFWTAVLRARRRGAGIVALLVATKLTVIIGALLTFAPQALYPVYGKLGSAWGVTLLEDQQLGGLLMMIGGGMMYMVVALLILARWLAVDVLEPPSLASARASEPARTA